jgi:hypothetical protein
MMRTFQIFILLLLTGCIQAQDVEFSASASPNVLRVGEQFNLIYSCNHELEEFDLPDVKDFDLLGGPSQGHSQNFTSINGKVTSSSTYQYTYFFRAVKEGKYTISPASIKIKNKIYRSNGLTIEVIKGTSQGSSSGHSATTNASVKQGGEIGDNDLFVRLVLDKKDAYLGEQIMATIKIYTKTNLAGIDPAFKGPDFTGFFTEPIETPPLRSLQREVVNGEIYYTGVIRRMVVIPQKTGELKIQAFDLDVAIRHEVRRKFADPFFDDFSVPDVQEIPVKLTSKAVTVNVKPLPGNAPSSFKGAVGNFRITSSLNKASTTTNEPLTLKVSISGKGNIKLINEVVVNVPYDMERYDPVINTHLDNPLSGSKTFEYLLMPKIPGDFVIPPAEFTYFDAVTGQYRTLNTQSYTVHVEKGLNDTLISMVPGMNKEDVKMLNQDIRYIKTNSLRLSKTGKFLASSPLYYLLFLLSFGGFIAFLVLRKKIAHDHADIAGLKLRKADKYARKRLRKCEILLKQGNDTAFYEEMLGALWGYLSHKLNIPISLLSKDSARTALQGRGVDEDLINQLFEVTNTCEMARYGHGMGDNVAKEELYRDSLKVITMLQQKLK